MNPSAEEQAFQARVTNTVIRLGLLALLVFWCFRILAPFINPILGGIIIAVAIQSLYLKLARALGNRPAFAASLITLLALVILIVPTVILGTSLAQSAARLTQEYAADSFSVPPPPAKVADWPLIGQPVHELWLGASQNLQAVIIKFAPQLKDAGLWLASKGGDLGWGLLLMIFSVIIAGLLLPRSEAATGFACRLATMVAGERGPSLVSLSAASIRNVTRGVLGVAAIQSALSGIAMALAGVPFTGLWAFLVLILAVMQLPSILVLLPVTIYVFSVHATWVAVLFAIASGIVGLSDNVLKPILMGRGSEIPAMVLFLGSLGGLMAAGILGLFVGAVILSLGYKLLLAWVNDPVDA